MEPKTKKWKNRKTNQKVKMCHILCFSKRLVATNEIRFKEVSDIGSMLKSENGGQFAVSVAACIFVSLYVCASLLRSVLDFLESGVDKCLNNNNYYNTHTHTPV